MKTSIKNILKKAILKELEAVDRGDIVVNPNNPDCIPTACGKGWYFSSLTCQCEESPSGGSNIRDAVPLKGPKPRPPQDTDTPDDEETDDELNTSCCAEMEEADTLFIDTIPIYMQRKNMLDTMLDFVVVSVDAIDESLCKSAWPAVFPCDEWDIPWASSCSSPPSMISFGPPMDGSNTQSCTVNTAEYYQANNTQLTFNDGTVAMRGFSDIEGVYGLANSDIFYGPVPSPIGILLEGPMQINWCGTAGEYDPYTEPGCDSVTQAATAFPESAYHAHEAWQGSGINGIDSYPNTWLQLPVTQGGANCNISVRACVNSYNKALQTHFYILRDAVFEPVREALQGYHDDLESFGEEGCCQTWNQEARVMPYDIPELETPPLFTQPEGVSDPGSSGLSGGPIS